MGKMNRDEIEWKFRKKRYETYEKKGHCVSCVFLHSIMNRILMPFFIMDRKMNHRELKIIKDLRVPTKKPVIFCPTHIGGIDVQLIFEMAHKPCSILLGDPEEFYTNFIGYMLKLNGWVPMNSKDKYDRTIAMASLGEILKRHGNLIIFPEGTENVRPSILLNHLYAGAVKLAITHDAEIIPVAFEREKNTYYCAVGKNISYTGRSIDDFKVLTNELRDEMATLKWDIFEQLPVNSRKDVSEEHFSEYLSQLFDVGVEYTMNFDDLKANEFHPKGEAAPDEVFSFMDHIEPRRENAFLFARRA